MNILNKHKESLIVQRALTLFFYNFNTYPDIIEEMKAEDSGFNHAWNNLVEASRIEHEKKGGMWIIQYTDIYTLFVTKLTFKAQALLIDKVLGYYGNEARKAIEFAMEMDAVATKQRETYKRKYL